MKAMELRKLGSIEDSPLQLVDKPLPEPRENEVRIKVGCCAICRTDLHIIEGDLPQNRLPIVPGHQIIGFVDKCGPGAKRFKIGTRVGIAWLRWVCGSCHFCNQGRENLCESPEFSGYHADGGYGEYAIVNQSFAYEIPSVFKDCEAAPLLCAGIIGYRALERCKLPRGGNLGIFGFGSSAHIVIQLAHNRDGNVYVITRGGYHKELAYELGASWVGDDPSHLPVELDSAIIFAPVGELVPIALSALKKGGTLSLAGIHMSKIPSLDYNCHLFFEKEVTSVTANTRMDGLMFLEEAAGIPIKPQITKFPLEQTNEALQLLKKDMIKGSGVIMIA